MQQIAWLYTSMNVINGHSNYHIGQTDLKNIHIKFLKQSPRFYIHGLLQISFIYILLKMH